MFDVHVRLRIEQLQSLQVKHIHSEVEESEPGGPLAGYTEWRADAVADPAIRAVSCGWDWTYERENALLLAQWSSLRTNLMVVADDGQDLGAEGTRLCVARLMTRERWEQAVAAQLRLTLRQAQA